MPDARAGDEDERRDPARAERPSPERAWRERASEEDPGELDRGDVRGAGRTPSRTQSSPITNETRAPVGTIRCMEPRAAIALIAQFEWPIEWPDRSELLRYAGVWAGVWLGVLVAAWLADFIAVRVIVRFVRAIVSKTSTTIDDIFVEHKVLQRLTRVVPALVVHSAAPLLFPEGNAGVEVVQRLANAWMIIAVARSADVFLDALVTIGQRSEGTRDKPIRSYVQVAKILLWMATGILTVAVLMDKSPWALLTGLGAMTAIILLVFKDSILGFVASIQIATNDLVRVGDWISMERYGADGDVIDIGLYSVKVQNWDKTVSAIPTKAFTSDSFKNWRGMTESGGRRIKRALSIDMGSVRFLDEEDIARLSKLDVLSESISGRAAEVATWNEQRGIDTTELANGRRLTNLGSFRAYLDAYLSAHPDISDEMTFLVRQLAPGPEGLPIEIYVFSTEQRWVQYEGIIGDIFDHLIASLPTFGLRPFQRPTGADLSALAAATDSR